MTDFKPIRQTRIYEEVVQQLKSAILDRSYRPGEKLPSERQLCDQFQVSRVVIREAIRVLELTGFVTLKQGPSGGAYVRELSYDHLSGAFRDLFLMDKLSSGEVLDLRLHIEPEIARIAAQNMDESWKRELTEIQKGESEVNLNDSKYLERNMKMHRTLPKMTKNRLYEAIMNPILDLTSEMLLQNQDKVAIRHSDHKNIIDAVMASDGEGAASAVTEHLSKIRNEIVGLEKEYRQKIGAM